MSREIFLLDENVFIFSHTLENEQGEIDTSSSELVQAVMANCHGLALSQELLARYSRKADAIQREGSPVAGTPVLPLMKEAAIIGKLEYVSDPPPIVQETDIHDDDVPVVRLASAAAAILVTTDNRLRQRLEQSGIAFRNGFRVMRPEESLPYAKRGDC